MRYLLLGGTKKISLQRRQWLKPTSWPTEVLWYPKIQGMWMLECGQRLLSKGISNASSSYHTLPWYIQCANACSDLLPAFAHDIVPQGWKGQPLSFWGTMAELRNNFLMLRKQQPFPCASRAQLINSPSPGKLGKDLSCLAPKKV